MSRIHGEILRLIEKYRIGTSAADREKVYSAIHKEMKGLRKDEKKIMLNLMDQARDVADQAAKKSGIVVQFSNRRAREQLELISRNGEQFVRFFQRCAD